MAFKRISPVLFFRLSLISALFFLVSLLLLCLTAHQTAGRLKVIAQFFPTADESPTLYEFSQLSNLTPLFEFSETNNKIPIVATPKDKKRIDEMLIRYYLEMRYTQIPDTYEMSYRWGVGGPVDRLSLPSVYAQFAKGLDKKVETLPDLVKTIKIKEVRAEGNKFTVDFYLYTTVLQGNVPRQEKRAVLEYRYEPRRRTLSSNFGNPYGMVITRFTEGNVQK